MRDVPWILSIMVDTFKITGNYAETYSIVLSVIDSKLYGLGDSFDIGLVYHTSGGDDPPFGLKITERLNYKNPKADDKSGDTTTAQARTFKGYGGRHVSFKTFLSRPTWLDQPQGPKLFPALLPPESAIWKLKQMASKQLAQRPTEIGAPMYPKKMITNTRGGEIESVTVPYHPVTTYPEVPRVPLLTFAYGNIKIAPCIITDMSIDYQGWRPMWEGLIEAEVSIELQEIMTRVSNWIPDKGALSSRPFRPSHREFITEREGFRNEKRKIKTSEAQTSIGRESAPAAISKRALTNREWIARGRKHRGRR